MEPVESGKSSTLILRFLTALMEEAMKPLRNLFAACLLCLPMTTLASAVIDLNTADSEALVDRLVGVGPHKAMAIIRYRQANGPFKHIDELAQVDGIGARTVELNRSRMKVGSPESPSNTRP
jgi:competence protein ComEA